MHGMLLSAYTAIQLSRSIFSFSFSVSFYLLLSGFPTNSFPFTISAQLNPQHMYNGTPLPTSQEKKMTQKKRHIAMQCNIEAKTGPRNAVGEIYSNLPVSQIQIPIVQMIVIREQKKAIMINAAPSPCNAKAKRSKCLVVSTRTIEVRS